MVRASCNIANGIFLLFIISLAPNLKSARAEDAKPPTPEQLKIKARLDRQARQFEIARQPEGIHKISDGTICIKSGPGLATVSADGRGCGTGCNKTPGPPPGPDNDLLTGVFFGLFAEPQDGANLGINAELSTKVKNAYNYMDYEGTNPAPVLKVYEKYAKAPDGEEKVKGEKALMEKVRAVGQAYIDADAKKLKDIKALLTPRQADGLRSIGAKILRPFEKPLA